LIYEAVLLFGIVMLAGLAYGAITQQQHALKGQWGLRAVLFLVLGIYFTGFWVRAGQTLAMKTWHIRLEHASGGPVSPQQALIRYLLSWVWVLPALAAAYLSGLHTGGWVSLFIAVGILGYAALASVTPNRQFVHDLICKTRLVDTRPDRPIR
jgi:uncharacterized RDD family membrane protein YckC